VKRTISVIVIIAVIALICVLEELAVSRVSSGLNDNSKKLYAQVLLIPIIIKTKSQTTLIVYII